MPRKAPKPDTRTHLGVGFNEAGAVMPRKGRGAARSAPPFRRASMRPGLLCPGKQALAGALALPDGASMRPGLLCPGKDEAAGGEAAARPASMRPGLLCPGKPMARRAGVLEKARLQ